MTEESTPKENTKPDYLKKIFEYFLKHPAVAGTVIYFGVSAIGVIYTWALYRQFKINIFDFAEANDFLLAAFKEPFSLLMTILTLFFGMVIGCVIYFLRKRLESPLSAFRQTNTWLSLAIVVIFLLTYLTFPAYYYANKNVKALLQDKKSIVNVLYKERQDEALTPVAQRLTASLIGSTDKFLFFYDHSNYCSIAIPIANITSIKFEPLVTLTAKELEQIEKEVKKVLEKTTNKDDQ